MLKDQIRNIVSGSIDDVVDNLKEWKVSLQEAKGISYEVEKETKNIVSYLQNYLNRSHVDYSKDKFQIKQLETKHEVFGEKVNFKITFYLFKNNDIYVQNEGNARTLYKYVPSSKTVYISVYVIGKKIVKNTFNSKIAHEIRHALQYKKTGKNNSELLHPIKHYQIVKDIIHKYEQESYSEELYNELMFSYEPTEVYFKKTNRM